MIQKDYQTRDTKKQPIHPCNELCVVPCTAAPDGGKEAAFPQCSPRVGARMDVSGVVLHARCRRYWDVRRVCEEAGGSRGDDES